jgi:hypothetical protein
LLLHFNSCPGSKTGIRVSAGASAGFLYSSGFKKKSNGYINKIRRDFDLEPFKFSWVGEIGVRGITL